MSVFITIIAEHIFLLWFVKKAQDSLKYKTACCRDVRASMGMWDYLSKVEEKRRYLNRPGSKF